MLTGRIYHHHYQNYYHCYYYSTTTTALSRLFALIHSLTRAALSMHMNNRRTYKKLKLWGDGAGTSQQYAAAAVSSENERPTLLHSSGDTRTAATNNISRITDRSLAGVRAVLNNRNDVFTMNS